MSLDIFDYILAFTLMFLTWQMMRAKDLLTSIVLFIIFGMLVAFAWVQLQAPDIALVEAIIGSALTGVLFLGCLGQIESSSHHIHCEKKSISLMGKMYNILFFLVVVSVGGILGWVLLALPINTEGLTVLVDQKLSQSGVENRVTAVILNFRAYDTLLEIGVLFLVVIAVFALDAARPITINLCLKRRSKVLSVFLYLLAPLMVLVSFYLLWVGGHAPGGAFQAGAMLAGVGILMLIGGVSIPINVQNKILRLTYALGFSGFLCVGLIVMGDTTKFLEYPQKQAKYFIFLIEFLSTISIAATLVTLFAGCSGFLKSEDLSEEVFKG